MEHAFYTTKKNNLISIYGFLHKFIFITLITLYKIKLNNIIT